jgi:hypothetical protein
LNRIQKMNWTRVLKWTAVAFVAFMVLGNLGIVVTSLVVRQDKDTAEGIQNFRQVDDRLWRGAAPTDDGYRWLADNGVTTVVDLRPEHEPNQELLAELGVRLVRIPIRDGQTPSQLQTTKFLESIQDSPGTTFVNCGAGVGRTGVMTAAYLVQTGQRSSWGALAHNLSVGPPSLEQLAFAAQLDGEFLPGPAHALVTATSRVLDFHGSYQPDHLFTFFNLL